MESFSSASEAFSSNPNSPDATQGTNAPYVRPNYQSSFIIPSSPVLQLLAQSDVQTEARRCLAQLGEHPTLEQWKMILSPTSSTCVIAGAGSGKSTTLILRLLILHKLLALPLDEIHVFSFTRASTQEFQQKLASKLIKWEEVIEQKAVTDQRRKELQTLAKRTVSTFHSVIARLSRDVLPGGSSNRQFFDLLGSTSSEEELSSYNPFVNLNLSDKQAEILNAAHTLAYERFPRYKELVIAVMQEQERQRWQRIANAPNQDDQFEQWKWDRLQKQELAYHGFTEDGRYAPPQDYRDQLRLQYIDPFRAAIADRLREWSISFSTLTRFPIQCPIPGGFPGAFYASFTIGDQLFLHIERYRSSLPRQGNEIGLSFHERDRRRFIATYSDHPDKHQIVGPEDFDLSGERPVLKADGDFKLQQWLKLNGYALTMTSAPAVRLQLPGDLHRAHMAELLYQEGVFLESLGLEIAQTCLPKQALDRMSAAIAEALPLFWQAFNAELSRRNLLRFHDILMRLRDPQTLHRLQDKLKHLRHLFIDEFQDISYEIVDWLAKTIRMYGENGVEVSVTAIGDDYQSIYSWRGSHPTFLMRFDRYFAAEPVGHIILTENFRSRQPIIDAAEAVLEPVKQKISKHGKSASLHIEDGRLPAIHLVETSLSWQGRFRETSLWQTFCHYATRLLRDLEFAGHLRQLVGNRRTLSVFILARTNFTRLSIPSTNQLRPPLLHALRQEGIHQFQDVGIQSLPFA